MGGDGRLLTLGPTVSFSGDRSVGNASYSNQWPSPQQVKSTVQYPPNGVGSIVTYVEIIVEQVSDRRKELTNLTFLYFSLIYIHCRAIRKVMPTLLAVESINGKLHSQLKPKKYCFSDIPLKYLDIIKLRKQSHRS